MDNFSDPLTDCKSCKSRFRADKLLDDPLFNEKTDPEKLLAALEQRKIVCPSCGKSDWTAVRSFNLMMKTFLGPVESSATVAYLRPETAQSIFTNFKNVQRACRLKIPFAIGQIGTAFRNEVTPGNFVFRTREFEQMELEHFCQPGQDVQVFEGYLKQIKDFLLQQVGLNEGALSQRAHDQKELAHYSQATTDFEFDFIHGKAELWGVAMRGDYDLAVHQKMSGKDLTYQDDANNAKYLPHVVEPSVGVGRLLYALWTSAYDEEILEDGTTRVVMRFKKAMAPVQLAVLPLVNKLNAKAEALYDALKNESELRLAFDSGGTIGKRYRRQDAIGTPFCATYDFASETDGCVTVRSRDSMEQTRVKVSMLKEYLEGAQ